MLSDWKFPKRPPPLRRLSAGVGAKEMPFYPRDEVYMNGLLPRGGGYNYGKDIKEGLDSNVIMAPMMWIARTFTEAKTVVETKRGESGVWKRDDDHALEQLIDKPNPFYDGDALWKATLISYVFQGDGYWLKVRNRIGDVIQLWYAAHWTIQPRWPHDGSEFISHYDYSPTGGQPIKLAPRDVVHFRCGLDPRDPRHGMGALRPLLREIFADEEAAAFSAQILTNMGVPGLIISPEESLTKPQAEEFKDFVASQFTGEGRGDTLVAGRKANVVQFGFDPNKLMLANLRDISEERVCAMLGIPAAVVGFGSGLQSTKVGATMAQLRISAWTDCLNPMQKTLAKQLTAQLLPDFNSQVRQYRARFDLSDVSAFQQEAAEVANRAALLVREGILRVDRAQEMCGLEVDPKREVYLQPTASQPIDKSGKPIEMPKKEQAGFGGDGDDDDEEIPAAVAARRNGNGNGSEP